MTATRLCRDCKHCIPAAHWRWPQWWHLIPIFGWMSFLVGIKFRHNYWRYAQCAHTAAPDYVAGDNPNMAGALNCSTERGSLREDACGPAAVHFEEKTS